jgi:hypothetical protein
VGRIVHKRSTWVAWSMLAIFVVAWAINVLLSAAAGSFQEDASLLPAAMAFTAFMVTGVVIVAHRPGNAVGWIFSAIGLLVATGTLATYYAEYAYVTRPGSLPGAILAAWYSQQTWYPMLTLVFVFTPLLFPTGRLLSARWRPVAVAAVVATAGITALTSLQATLKPLNEHYAVPNPIGLAGIQDPENSPVGAVLFGLLLLCMGAAVLSLALRFRRSKGVERQQLKWFTYAGTLVVLWLPATNYLLPGVLPDVAAVHALFWSAVAFVPVSAGIAILRYRLFDIDRIINRTLVYGLLTALLGALYAGVVLVLGQLFSGIGDNPPSWIIAGATLAVAAVFQPARHRIQQAVDRHFNRRKYDTAQISEAYNVRLRGELDLDTLSAELLAVVDQTMQPTQASLWLRPSMERVRQT